MPADAHSGQSRPEDLVGAAEDALGGSVGDVLARAEPVPDVARNWGPPIGRSCQLRRACSRGFTDFVPDGRSGCFVHRCKPAAAVRLVTRRGGAKRSSSFGLGETPLVTNYFAAASTVLPPRQTAISEHSPRRDERYLRGIDVYIVVAQYGRRALLPNAMAGDLADHRHGIFGDVDWRPLLAARLHWQFA